MLSPRGWSQMTPNYVSIICDNGELLWTRFGILVDPSTPSVQRCVLFWRLNWQMNRFSGSGLKFFSSGFTIIYGENHALCHFFGRRCGPQRPDLDFEGPRRWGQRWASKARYGPWRPDLDFGGSREGEGWTYLLSDGQPLPCFHLTLRTHHLLTKINLSRARVPMIIYCLWATG